MHHPEDIHQLKRILGRDDIPPDVIHEYELVQRMYHRAGESGPVRTLGLIDLVRRLGHKPPNVEPPPTQVDWRKFPQDGSVRVSAHVMGDWRPGKFLGFVESGTLAIRLDDNPMVRECRPSNVRLLEVTEDIAPATEPPDARAQLLEPPFVERAEFPDDDEEDEDDEDEDSEIDDTDVIVVERKAAKKPSPPPTGTIDWNTIAAQTPVWVCADNDVLDGAFLGVGDTPGTLAVALGGACRTVPAGDVNLAGTGV